VLAQEISNAPVKFLHVANVNKIIYICVHVMG
jgi:hypothetical protein